MRGYKAIIKEAELLASSPETIAAFLKERAERIASNRWGDGDAELEASLAKLKHPLIDISLAQYCFHIQTARSLFFAEQRNNALRLAVLSNSAMGAIYFGASLHEIFENEAAFCAYLADASDDEITAIFNNPTLQDSFLSDFLKGKTTWKSLNEERQQRAIMALSNNDRMQTPYDKRFMDGYAEYIYSSVFDAAWHLAATLPVTKDWALALSQLYRKTLPTHLDKPEEIAARWQAQNEEEKKEEAESNQSGYLSYFQLVRAALAKLAISNHAHKADAFLIHEDIAFRAAAYSYAYLTTEQISKAYERDGELAFNEMVYNERLWKTHATRQELHDIAWAVVKNDKHADLMAANTFNSVEEAHTKSHPEWFQHEEDEPQPNPAEALATKEDIRALTAQLEQSTAIHTKIQTGIDTANVRLGFVWWFSLGTLVGMYFLGK